MVLFTILILQVVLLLGPIHSGHCNSNARATARTILVLPHSLAYPTDDPHVRCFGRDWAVITVADDESKFLQLTCT